MLDPVHDECGVAAVYRTDRPLPGAAPGELLPPDANVVRLLLDMLIDLQNRGQLAAGITRYNENADQLIDTKRDVGSVSDVFHLTLPNPAKFLGISRTTLWRRLKAYGLHRDGRSKWASPQSRS